MDINFCPMCMFQPSVFIEDDEYYLECPYCKRRSKRAATTDEAIRNWNRDTFDDFCHMQNYLYQTMTAYLE